MLLAANEASASTAAVIADVGRDPSTGSGPLVACLRAYREGYTAALATVALAFGLSPAGPFAQPDIIDVAREMLEQ